MSPRAHFLTGIPVAIAGATGSLFVIAVNGFMQHPTGFRLENGEAVDVKPFDVLVRQQLLLARVRPHVPPAFMVAGFLSSPPCTRPHCCAAGRSLLPHRPADPPHRRRRSRRPPSCSSATGPPREVAAQTAGEARRLRGAGQDHQGGRPAPARVVRGRGGQGRDRLSGLLSFLADHDFNSTVKGSTRSRPTTAEGDQPHPLLLGDHRGDRVAAGGDRRRPPLLLGCANGGCGATRWFLRGIASQALFPLSR